MPSRVASLLSSAEDWLNVSRRPSSADFDGRILLLDFWTFCCINCMHVLPDLAMLEREYDGVITVIGVHAGKFENEKSLQAIADAVKRYDIKHPVVNDPRYRLWSALGIQAWPTLVLVTPEGRVFKRYSGEGHLPEIRRDIESVRDEYRTEIRQDPFPIAVGGESKAIEVPACKLSYPGKVVVADELQLLFIADSGHNRIVAVDLSGRVRFVIGSSSGAEGFVDGGFDECRFNRPQGLAYQNGLLYVADTWNHSIRRADLNSWIVETIAGDGRQTHRIRFGSGDARRTSLSSPWDLAFFPTADDLAIAMAGTHQLIVLNLKSGLLDVLAGNGQESIDDGAWPFNTLAQPSGLSAAKEGLYFLDTETSSLRLLVKGEVTTLIGAGLFDFGFLDGDRNQALMQHPLGLEAKGNSIYIADSYNHAIRRYDRLTGRISTICGKPNAPGKNDGSFDVSTFNEPSDIAINEDRLFVADTNNGSIRVVDLETRSVTAFELSQDEALGRFEPLPNLRQSRTATVRGGLPLIVKLEAVGGAKLNKESWLALYLDGSDTPKLVHKASGDDLAGLRAEFASLSAGSEYRLRGSVYYCSRDGETELCKVDSYDIRIIVDDGGGAKPFVIIPFG